MSGRRSSTDRNSRARSLVRRPCGASARCPAGGISLRDARGQPGRPASSDPRASFRRTGSDSGRVVPTPAVRDRRGSPRCRCTPRSRPAAGRDRGTRAVRGHRRAHVVVVHARGWIRSGSLRRLSRMSWRLQQTAARTAATCQLQSSLPLPPSVDENGVRLCLSGTWLDDDEQAAHDAQVAGRLLGTTETAEQPGVSARTVERFVAASRQSVQPAMARGCQGQARDVPDDAFRRRTTAIGWPWRRLRALGQPPPQARSSVANMHVVFHLSASKTCSDVDCGAIQRLKTKESSDGTFGEHG
jgi:hypothetical protein